MCICAYVLHSDKNRKRKFRLTSFCILLILSHVIYRVSDCCKHFALCCGLSSKK